MPHCGGAHSCNCVVTGDGVSGSGTLSDPYVITSVPEGGGAVDSVNGEVGAVVLDAADVGADPAGTAAGLVGALVIPDSPDDIGAATAAQGAKADTAVQPDALTAAVSGKSDKSGTPKSLADFGVLPTNTAAQNRTGFTAAAASTYTDFVLPAGTYQWSAAAEGQWMMSWTGKRRIRIRGLNAVINDTTTYTNNGAFTGLFLLDDCKDFELSGIEYVGPALGSPSTLLGHQGATLVRAINGTDGVKVDLRASNCRYGVQTGEYGDATKGQCKNFDLKVRGTMIGYALAAYLAEGIRHDIDVDGIHRGVYLAGCHDVAGVLRWRDQYIADTAYLLTDALVSGTDIAAQVAPPANPTTSRGCRNVTVASIDKGSTVTPTNSVCAGFNLSRVDPITHSNIDITVQTTSTDTVSRYVGGFRIASDAKTVWDRYPFNFEPTVVFQNVRVSGVIDHSAQTLSGNTAGDIYVMAFESSAAHAATIQNFRLDNLTIHKSAGGTRQCWLYMPGLADAALLTGVVAPVQDWAILTNATSAVRIQGCRLGPVDPGTSILSVTDSTLGSLAAAATNTTVTNSTASGAGMLIRQKSTTLTLAGASTSWTAAVPSGCLVLGVQAFITTAITGATGYNLGVSGDISRYANTNTITAGGTIGPANQAATEVSPRYYAGATDLVMTAKTSNFTGGQVRLILTYAQFTTPTA